jgi:hypothetical protein
VTADDIMEFDLDYNPIGQRGRGMFIERFIRGKIYKALAGRQRVVRSHSPASFLSGYPGPDAAGHAYRIASIRGRTRMGGRDGRTTVGRREQATLATRSTRPRRQTRSRPRQAHAGCQSSATSRAMAGPNI